MKKLTKKELNQLLSDLELELENKFKDNFTGLVLFGSYAKNKATERSDVDVLLTFKKLPLSPIKKFSLIRDIIMDLESNNKININPIMMRESNLKITPLLIDISDYAKIFVDKNELIKVIFNKIKEKYDEGNFKKIIVSNHYMLQVENG